MKIPCNLDPRFEIDESEKNKWFVHVIHRVHIKSERRYDETEDVIRFETLAEFQQWEKHKGVVKTISSARMIHDPLKKTPVKTNDDLAEAKEVPEAKEEKKGQRGRPSLK